MDEATGKRVDESWKEQVEKEKHVVTPAAAASSPVSSASAVQRPSAGPAGPARPGVRGEESAEPLEARFDLFLSGLMMEALVALGDMPHPSTRQPQTSLPRAKYLIDLLGVLEEKTKGNLTADEETLMTDALYQLRMRYLAKAPHA